MDYDIQIKRQNRRTVTLSVKPPNIIAVSAPLTLSNAVISEFINKKQKWITSAFNSIRKNDDLLSYKAETPKYLYYLGTRYPIQVNDVKSIMFNGNDIYFPKNCKLKNIESWFKSLAHDVFQDRLDVYANQMDLNYDALRIKTFRARWGSCSSKKIITLNWKLMFSNLEVIDYVVIHELAHLKHMNHSSKFWDVVASVQPEYKKHHLLLKKSAWLLR